MSVTVNNKLQANYSLDYPNKNGTGNIYEDLHESWMCPDDPDDEQDHMTGNECQYEGLRNPRTRADKKSNRLTNNRRGPCCTRCHCFLVAFLLFFVVATAVGCSVYFFVFGPSQVAIETTTSPRDRPRDCNDIFAKNKNSVSQAYRVFPVENNAIDVFCEMDAPGGPWLVFQRRKDGSVDFYRNWKNYTDGFGDLNGDFWLGNENLHVLTSNGRYKLRIDLEDWMENTAYAMYSSFSISSNSDYYRLNVSGYSGSAGDSLTTNHSGQPFSTKDADHDLWSDGSCAKRDGGAWWYHGCYNSNLNGPYVSEGYATVGGNDTDGVTWGAWRGVRYSLKTTDMKISRIDYIH